MLQNLSSASGSQSLNFNNYGLEHRTAFAGVYLGSSSESHASAHTAAQRVWGDLCCMPHLLHVKLHMSFLNLQGCIMEPHVMLGSGLTTRSLQEVSTAMFASGCMTGRSTSWLDIAALLIRSTTKQTTSHAVIAEAAALYYGQ